MGGLSIGKGINYKTQGSQTLVNILGLGKGVTCSSSLTDSLRSSQIYKVNLSAFGTEISSVLLVNLKNKATVGS